MPSEKPLTYKDAGVDISAADMSKKEIKKLISSTFSKYVIPDTEGLGAMFELPKGYNNPILVSGTDGVGTKLKIAVMMDKHDTIGIDLVAMCANDIIRRGAKPLYFMDYIATGKLEKNQVNYIVRGVVEGCRQAECSLIGGETAQMPDFYGKGDYDISGFCTGIVEKGRLIDGSKIRSGDVIVGFASTGLHSNGYSLARKALFPKYSVFDIVYDGRKLGEELIAPTQMYVRAVLDILENHFEDITGLAHITGSAFTKLMRFGRGFGYQFDRLFPIPKIFGLIQEAGNITDAEMFSTFNMGCGFMIVCRKADFLDGFFEKYGYCAEVIGKVDDSGKVRIPEKGIVL
ncbi:MAG: phosphoribosylformylglycinamidine cyclo-ligase [Nanoarchaeota archaeon]|nr:phosphoribosylformylglycinamidine cyclo-ligase [Nanoarchaeota archaeon]